MALKIFKGGFLMKKTKKQRVYVESEVPCPSCLNLLLEIVDLPAETCKESENDELLIAKRRGYYCPECKSRFNINLFPEDSL